MTPTKREWIRHLIGLAVASPALMHSFIPITHWQGLWFAAAGLAIMCSVDQKVITVIRHLLWPEGARALYVVAGCYMCFAGICSWVAIASPELCPFMLPPALIFTAAAVHVLHLAAAVSKTTIA